MKCFPMNCDSRTVGLFGSMGSRESTYIITIAIFILVDLLSLSLTVSTLFVLFIVDKIDFFSLSYMYICIYKYTYLCICTYIYEEHVGEGEKKSINMYTYVHIH